MIAGPLSHMLDSYVDVTQPAAASLPAVKGGFSGLAHILELATSHSQIDHPICAKCLDNVKREIQDSIAAAEAQASAYEAALKSLLVTVLSRPPYSVVKMWFSQCTLTQFALFAGGKHSRTSFAC